MGGSSLPVGNCLLLGSGLPVVGVFGPRVDLNVAPHFLAKRPFREHAKDGPFKDGLREPFHLLVKRARFQATRIAGVAVVHHLLPLAARQANLRSVENDHVVTVVEVRLKRRLVFADNELGHLRRHAAEGLIRGIDNVPVLVDVIC